MKRSKFSGEQIIAFETTLELSASSLRDAKVPMGSWSNRSTRRRWLPRFWSAY